MDTINNIASIILPLGAKWTCPGIIDSTISARTNREDIVNKNHTIALNNILIKILGL